MTEKQVERYLCKRIKAIGGLCFKWISPGSPGVPDRIIIFANKVHFVELKKPKANLRREQEHTFQKIQEQYRDVDVLYDYEDVDMFIASIAKFNT